MASVTKGFSNLSIETPIKPWPPSHVKTDDRITHLNTVQQPEPEPSSPPIEYLKIPEVAEGVKPSYVGSDALGRLSLILQLYNSGKQETVKQILNGDEKFTNEQIQVEVNNLYTDITNYEILSKLYKLPETEDEAKMYLAKIAKNDNEPIYTEMPTIH